MNIAVTHAMKPLDPVALLDARSMTSEALAEADAALDEYIAKISRLIGVGIKASDRIARPSCLVSPRAFGYAAHALSLASQLQSAHLEMHVALHEDGDRLANATLAPNDEPQKAGGGGGKEPPPKP